MEEQKWKAQLDTYLDGELPSAEMKELDAHVRTCPSCAADIVDRLALRRSVQTAGKRYTPDAALRERVRKQIGSRRRFPWKGWLAAAASLAVLGIAGYIGLDIARVNLHRRQVLSEIADLHVAALASTNPVDVVSSDRHTVKPWFQGKVPFTFNLPELEGTDYTLLGGRMVYMRQIPGAELIYQIRKHHISVFIFPDNAVPGQLPTDSELRKEMAFTVDSWSDGGLRYLVIGDPEQEDVAKLAEMFRKAARG